MRTLSKIVLAATTGTAIIAAAAPAFAEDKAKERFVHEGYTYVYDVKATKDGQRISGTRYPGAVAFQLNVRGEKVIGTSNGAKVAFNLAEARGATQ